MKSDKPLIKIIYIVGYGRSGSTILSTILGNHSQMVSPGEICNLVRDAWISNVYCSCHQRSNDCSFWREVHEKWYQRTNINALEKYLELQNIFENNKNIFSWLNLYKKIDSVEFQNYAKLTRELFTAITDVSGKSIIVDSSKKPARALALSMIPGLEVYLIHLVRDGRGVAFSLNKSYLKDEKIGIAKNLPSKSIWKTAIVWTIINLQSETIIKYIGYDKSIRITYENLMNNPQKILNDIGALINLDFSELIPYINQEKKIEQGHQIAGNRLRMSEDIVLHPDYQWIENLSTSNQRLFWFIAGWLAHKYGYTIKPNVNKY